MYEERETPARPDEWHSSPMRTWLKLARCPGLSVRVALELARAFKGARKLFEAPACELRERNVPLKVQRALSSDDLERTVQEELARAGRSGFRLIGFDDTEYPSGVRTLWVPPLVLAIKGDPLTLKKPGVAIVGSRKASAYASSMAHSLGARLAEEGCLVVSGMAYGIDAAAHEGALSVNGSTAAVMGTGPDGIYPTQHIDLAARIAGSGALLTEFPPGMPALGYNFPRRNRIIVGLSEAVVVVEATEKSGSLTTASIALEENRELLAVPGRVGEPNAMGTLGLIYSGAQMVCCARHVLDAIAARLEPRPADPVGGPPSRKAVDVALARFGDQADVMRRVLDLLPLHDEVMLDVLLEHDGIGTDELLTALFALELAGLVEPQPGSRFRRSTTAGTV